MFAQTIPMHAAAVVATDRLNVPTEGIPLITILKGDWEKHAIITEAMDALGTDFFYWFIGHDSGFWEFAERHRDHPPVDGPEFDAFMEHVFSFAVMPDHIRASAVAHLRHKRTEDR